MRKLKDSIRVHQLMRKIEILVDFFSKKKFSENNYVFIATSESRQSISCDWFILPRSHDFKWRKTEILRKKLFLSSFSVLNSQQPTTDRHK